MKRTKPRAWLSLIAVPAVVLLLGAADVFSREVPEDTRKSLPGILSFFIENDLFAGTDRRYTNGVKAVWVSPELGRPDAPLKLPGWLNYLSRRLPPVPPVHARQYLSVFLGQSMYTPENINQTEVLPGERPYAGYTYFGLGFHARDADSMDTIELTLGLVGPHSLAGDTQRLWHKIFGYDAPRGWAHQLRDEPVLGIVYDHKEKALIARRDRGFGEDVIVHAGASLSNAWTAGQIGMEARAGWNLPGDFGSAHIQPGADSASLFEEGDRYAAGRSGLGIYGFLAVEGYAVVRDIFLDGNTFGVGPRVEKFPFRGEIAAGFALRFNRLKFSYGYVFGSRQFETEKRGHIYGSINLSLTFRD